ncbi:MAG TPA: hypothetical protein P5163_09880 [Rubrivivax sp.]|nr:hypothetical protein [Rubrivivax sp.]HRY87650.1 hypothetical protein [Rubrivivax sp.]HRZ60893.1 hypothetical protein [Rubrivivax sp.]
MNPAGFPTAAAGAARPLPVGPKDAILQPGSAARIGARGFDMHTIQCRLPSGPGQACAARTPGRGLRRHLTSPVRS